MNRKAWPQGYRAQPKEEFNLSKWKEAALKIKMAMRHYGDEYSTTELIDNFTDGWDYQEQSHFRDWWRHNEKYPKSLYPKGQNKMMTKTAYDYDAAQKDDRLNELKKKLRSRVNSAEKLLNTMMDEGLLEGNEEKAVYLGRILQKLKEEVNLLKRPALIEARHKRVRNILHKAGLDEVANIIAESTHLVAEFNKRPLVKTADYDLKGILEDIRRELDAFNYGVHLDRFMKIKRQLEGAGRHSEASMIVDIIKKELTNVDGIHKKLVEVYSTLSSVPAEGRGQERLEHKEKPAPKPEEPTDELGIEMPQEREIEFPEEARAVPGL